jgi:hypothetical protein
MSAGWPSPGPGGCSPSSTTRGQKCAVYISLDILVRCRPATATPEKAEEVTLTALTA